ncbi:MAG: protein-methionine-sulfoxide reductase heme-binding subunit MsrQ [Rhodobacteraceae bacterium]|nr:protein-methionine-sulfoxide reductase heme-binding subunit MsrQ [Paracoccaceae bacterium]
MVTNRINAVLRGVPPGVVYVLGLVPVPWLFYQAATGALGFRPHEALEHALGETALQLLILGLALTPFKRFVGVNLLRFRRAVGLLAFIYVVLHLLVWLILDVQILSAFWADIVKRPYITVGMLAFTLMLPLAVTSNAWSLRRLGRAWHRLHRLTYAVAVLGAVHFVMLRKGFQIEPLLYLGTVLILLGLRLIPKSRPSQMSLGGASRGV